ncbi:DNA transposase [Frankliniella fusca]|uniref:DNA transposase n=1 Tax=Frankliniella fusca TaxID=407009 RepID=A0AAE1LP01_9NEOP|nr:DNA transposase [Frankliniella fusca]
MAACVYPYCVDKPALNYFRIPIDPELRKKWMSAIPKVENLTAETLGGRVYLCSRHFHLSCFDRDHQTRKITGLKREAVPSVFYIPSNDSNAITIDEDSLTGCRIPEGESAGDPEAPEAAGAAGAAGVAGAGTVQPPKVSASTSNKALCMKVRSQELKLLILKERIKDTEEEINKAKEHMKEVDQGIRNPEVEERYSNLLKKLRPIAPKKPQKKKPKTLEEVILYARKERLLSHEASSIFLNLFADVALEDVPSYPSREGLRCFCQYLLFYNSEAFDKIISTFDIALPPVSSIRMFFNTNFGDPGWNHEAFNSMRQQTTKDSKLLCSLLVFETPLKRKEEWDGQKMRGYVDCGPPLTGTELDLASDGLPSARLALILMVVPLQPQEFWRAPVAYFFINTLSSSERANIIRECILRLHSAGSIVLSVTCDIHSSDKSFLNALGVSYELLPQICPYFVHPSDPLLRVHVVFDHCSLLISVQNMWASSQGFLDKDGGSVLWRYVAELIKLLEAQALGLAQNYDAPHWCWEPTLIKNKLLAQLFTDSTANALEYCCNVLNLAQFYGCEATVKFIRSMSKISKLLSSRRNLKSSLNGVQEASVKSEYVSGLDYLYHLYDMKNEPLHSADHGCIRLLYFSLLSVQELLRQVPGFSSHCVSLDEAAMLPYVIRTYTDWRSLPTARQFTAAFTAHVEKYGYFTSWSCAQTNNYWWVDSLDVSTARKEGCRVSKPEFANPSIATNFNTSISTEHVQFTSQLKSFSSGTFTSVCVVKAVSNILHCEACLDALQDPPVSDNPLLVLLRKTCGAAICPSKDVLKVCACTERNLQEMLKTTKPKVKQSIFEWRDEAFVAKIAISVVKDIMEKDRNIFGCLKQHILQCAPDANHEYRLIRGISSCYALMRLRNFKSWCPT